MKKAQARFAIRILWEKLYISICDVSVREVMPQ
jgi:hypothetical protein